MPILTSLVTYHPLRRQLLRPIRPPGRDLPDQVERRQSPVPSLERPGDPVLTEATTETTSTWVPEVQHIGREHGPFTGEPRSPESGVAADPETAALSTIDGVPFAQSSCHQWRSPPWLLFFKSSGRHPSSETSGSRCVSTGWASETPEVPARTVLKHALLLMAPDTSTMMPAGTLLPVAAGTGTCAETATTRQLLHSTVGKTRGLQQTWQWMIPMRYPHRQGRQTGVLKIRQDGMSNRWHSRLRNCVPEQRCRDRNGLIAGTASGSFCNKLR